MPKWTHEIVSLNDRDQMKPIEAELIGRKCREFYPNSKENLVIEGQAELSIIHEEISRNYKAGGAGGYINFMTGIVLRPLEEEWTHVIVRLGPRDDMRTVSHLLMGRKCRQYGNPDERLWVVEGQEALATLSEIIRRNHTSGECVSFADGLIVSEIANAKKQEEFPESAWADFEDQRPDSEKEITVKEAFEAGWRAHAAQR